MRLELDSESNTLTVDGRRVRLDTPEAFDILSREWLKLGWTLKYPYTFSWMGRPIIQAPEDIVRTQEVIYRVKPDVIVETGVAHGGSLIFYASLFRAMGKGRVVGVDIEIRPHNRAAIEAHELSSLVTLIEGGSTDPATVDQVRSMIRPGETVMVILDSNHSKQHVADELAAYAGMVTPGAYIVATDGSMQWLADSPRGQADWTWNNPTAAAAEFAAEHPEFVLEQPPWPFNESELAQNITHWPGAWLRRL
jgi:cephalosporin hydroxylase